MKKSWFVIFAALNGAMAVVCGALAAHFLNPVGDALAISLLLTGSQYQVFHSLALLGVAALNGKPATSWCFTLGIVLFSGSLYLMALTGAEWLGFLRPLGGLAFIAGWLSLAWFSYRGEI